jgi:hypothetical protein
MVDESPFERGLRLERVIRVAPPLLPEERAQDVSFFDRERQRELELCDAALRAVARASATEQGLAPEVAVDVEVARPACKRGIIYRTPEVESAERALRWGLVAFVSGTGGRSASRRRRRLLLSASPSSKVASPCISSGRRTS